MLVVRRASITEAPGRLQEDGIITYRRGVVSNEYEQLVPLAVVRLSPQPV
jgi:hypothetical protein